MNPLLVLGGLQSLYGIYQSMTANNAIDNMQKPQGYSITPELRESYQRAEDRAKMGYTAAEKNNFEQGLARANNAAYNRAMIYGGNNLAGAIRSGINYGNMGALSSFAANDASLKRQNEHYADQVANQVTAQRNRAVAQDWANYNAEQSAYGQSAAKGVQNFFGGLNMGAAGLMGSGGGGTGTTKTVAPETTAAAGGIGATNPFGGAGLYTYNHPSPFGGSNMGLKTY